MEVFLFRTGESVTVTMARCVNVLTRCSGMPISSVPRYSVSSNITRGLDAGIGSLSLIGDKNRYIGGSNQELCPFLSAACLFSGFRL